MAAIKTEGLSKTFPAQVGKKAKHALTELSIEVGEHEIYGFLGQNGAGKTTTIKLLTGLLHPTHGRAFILGESASERTTRRHIGYLPENPYFYEYLTPRETLDFYGRLHSLSKKARAEEWARLGELLNLKRIGNERVRGFSKGMRQRLGFAVALVGNPEVLILDEPMSGLDPLGRRMIRELILQLHNGGKTIFFSSHVLGDVEEICDRVGILANGTLRTEGHLDDLLTRRLNYVSVLARGIDDAHSVRLVKHCTQMRKTEGGYEFHAPDIAAANALVRALHQMEGEVLECTPVKESLEDYFMREQEGVS